jgi:hypothetical protein
LSDATVKQLIAIGEERGVPHPFVGIYKIEDGSSMLQILSARQSIANNAASAASKGGHYLPSAAMREDVVFMSCGDEDLGDRWDCARLSVSTNTGRRVTPITYASEPRAYHNAFGATWTARKTIATFRVSDLRDGFTVTFAGTDGAEYREQVTKDQAADELLFTVPPLSAASNPSPAAPPPRAPKPSMDQIAEGKAAAKAAEPDPPDVLRLSLETLAVGWKITSHNAGYTWRECKLVIGANTATLPPLNPEVPITVTRSAFDSSTELSTQTKPVVRCVAKGSTFEPFEPR